MVGLTASSSGGLQDTRDLEAACIVVVTWVDKLASMLAARSWWILEVAGVTSSALT
jgi:hypothetical protein